MSVVFESSQANVKRLLPNAAMCCDGVEKHDGAVCTLFHRLNHSNSVLSRQQCAFSITVCFANSDAALGSQCDLEGSRHWEQSAHRERMGSVSSTFSAKVREES